jgi:hypothetical protein
MDTSCEDPHADVTWVGNALVTFIVMVYLAYPRLLAESPATHKMS